MPGVVIVSRDWQSRAPLRAQMIEEGCAVRAYESLRDAAVVLAGAVGTRTTRGFKPGLLIADLSDDGGPKEIDQFSRVARRLPVWVIASRSSTNETALSDRGFERVFFRPVDVRELVESIKQRVGSIEAKSKSR